MHIGLLQTGHLPEDMQAETGDYDALFERLLENQGLKLSVWPVVDGIFPPDIHAADGWLITGSKHGAYDDLPWIPPLEDFIRNSHSARVPMVGICFGHQIIAQALGGKVEKFSGGWAVGPHAYEWDGETVTLNAWHQDQVVEAPEEARVIATSPFCANAAMIYGDHIFTIQAHPEFDAQAVDILARTRGPGVIPEPLLEAAQAGLSKPTDAARMANRIGTFLKEAFHG